MSLTTAIAAAGVAAGLLAAVLVYLARLPGANRALWFWAAAYVAYALRAAVLVASGGIDAGWVALAAELLLVAVVALQAVGLLHFLDRPARAEWVVAGAVLAGAWAVAATLVGASLVWRTAPVFVGAGATLVALGWLCWRKRLERPDAGYGALGVLLILWGGHLADYPLLRPVPWFAPYGFALAATLLLALGMVMMVAVLHGQRHATEEATRRLFLSERRLAENNQRLRDFAEASSDWFWELDAELRVTYVTPSAADLLWLPVDTVVGRRLWELPVGSAADARGEELRRTLEAHRPFRDLRFSRPAASGETLHLSLSGRPFFGTAGSFLGYRGIGRDISGEVAAELAASSIRDRFLHAIESRSEGISLWDRDDRFVICNSQYRKQSGAAHDALTPGHSFEDYIRRSIETGEIAIGDRDPEQWLAERLAHHRLGPVTFELERGGTWLLVHEAPAPDGGTLIAVTDISELKRRERDLRAAVHQAELANRTKSEFLATMSHELRTPLNAVLGFAEMIRDRALGADAIDKYAEYAGHIHASGRHLLALINDVLEMSKIEAGRYELHEERMDVRDAIAEALVMIRPRAAEARVKIRRRVASTLPPVYADARGMRQVLLNVLSNATKFTPAGGRIEVTAGLEPGGSLAVTISDTGIGIDPRQIERVFEPFRQLERVENRRFGGTGLGLAISRNIMRLHGGDVTIAPRDDGGTAVRITLPPDRVLADAPAHQGRLLGEAVSRSPAAGEPL